MREKREEVESQTSLLAKSLGLEFCHSFFIISPSSLTYNLKFVNYLFPLFFFFLILFSLYSHWAQIKKNNFLSHNLFFFSWYNCFSFFPWAFDWMSWNPFKLGLSTKFHSGFCFVLLVWLYTFLSFEFPRLMHSLVWIFQYMWSSGEISACVMISLILGIDLLLV